MNEYLDIGPEVVAAAAKMVRDNIRAGTYSETEDLAVVVMAEDLVSLLGELRNLQREADGPAEQQAVDLP